MTPFVRRTLYVVLFEAVGVLFVSLGLTLFSGRGVDQTAPVAIACSTIAMAWNFAFNTAFEAWERRQSVRGRSFWRRCAHALGFEVGLVLLLVPLMAWWLVVSLLEAFLYDFGLVLFFIVYGFTFNLAFDAVFGLPASARPLDTPADGASRRG